MEEVKKIINDVRDEFPNVEYFFSDDNRKRILHLGYEATFEDIIKYGGKTKSNPFVFIKILLIFSRDSF